MSVQQEPVAGGYSIDGENFTVLVNSDEQYSLWPARKRTPEGWFRIGPEGSKQDCLQFVEANWKDMRPRSLREAMARPAVAEGGIDRSGQAEDAARLSA